MRIAQNTNLFCTIREHTLGLSDNNRVTISTMGPCVLTHAVLSKFQEWTTTPHSALLFFKCHTQVFSPHTPVFCYVLYFCTLFIILYSIRMQFMHLGFRACRLFTAIGRVAARSAATLAACCCVSISLVLRPHPHPNSELNSNTDRLYSITMLHSVLRTTTCLLALAGRGGYIVFGHWTNTVCNWLA